MRVCIRVFGIVQGVGFRPTVKRHADACDIAGSVSNKGPYVEIFAEGSEECVNSFIKQIQEEPPKRAVILKLDVENVESGEDGIHKVESETDSKEKFQIIESEKEEGEIFVSPDIAICPECKKELYDKNDRRYLHPFINCTCCGPRLTILDSMPEYGRVWESFRCARNVSMSTRMRKREGLMHSQSAVTTAGQKYICLGGKNGEQMRFVIQER